jgi:hypothetical protein
VAAVAELRLVVAVVQAVIVTLITLKLLVVVAHLNLL